MASRLIRIKIKTENGMFFDARLFYELVFIKIPYCLSVITLMLSGPCNCDQRRNVQYTNQWTVEIEGGDATANEIARKHGFRNFGKLFDDAYIYMFHHPEVLEKSSYSSHVHNIKLLSHAAVQNAEQQIIKKRVKRDQTYFTVKNPPKDPLWRNSWYLLPSTQPSMKVFEAWQEGYTGKGVTVTILDDGIEYTHPDLADNYDKLASRDVNNGDDDPIPRATYSNENRHGTRCAGEVAAVANNNYCSVGIAYEASIGGVRMLDGQVTDMVEGASIGLRPDYIDIYSASWGPDDDGKTVDGPAKKAKEAFEKGVKTGRKGKGSIFVWASGNGGKKDDNCNCDGYTNSIYTLSISSTTEHTETPWYSEDCSSTLACTYSSGIGSEKQIVTTDLDKKCTQSHTGTSASAPLAAGICALALEANSNLTWRDMQHIVVQTANPEGLKADDWTENAIGRKVSHYYGYGLMDAHAMVQKAKTWVTVPEQRKCSITIIESASSETTFSKTKPLKITFDVDKCNGVMPDRLEHVQAEISTSCDRRGEMNIYLTSAMGTKSTLLDRRKLDVRSAGFTKWPFMTTHNWDEDPKGSWTLEISADDGIGCTGKMSYFNLVLYGTQNRDWTVGLMNNTYVSTKYITKDITTQSATRSAAEDERTTAPNNCKVFSRTTNVCLVCKDKFVLSPDRLSCLASCPQGYLISLEKNNESDESHQGVYTCVRCNAGMYCATCNTSNITNCLKCIEGFELVYGRCSAGLSKMRQKIYNLTVIVCIFSVLVFILLFMFLQYCRSQNKHCYLSGEPLYAYMPNDVDKNFGGKAKHRRSSVEFAQEVLGNQSTLNYPDANQALLGSGDERP